MPLREYISGEICFIKDRPKTMTIAINKGMDRIIVLLM
jgi:hypothetical protein